MQELRGFKKVKLQSGEKSKVRFTINDDVLSYYDHNGTQRVDNGDFKIWIVPHSRCGEPLIYTH